MKSKGLLIALIIISMLAGACFGYAIAYYQDDKSELEKVYDAYSSCKADLETCELKLMFKQSEDNEIQMNLSGWLINDTYN